MRTTNLARTCAAALLALSLSPAHAFDPYPDGVAVHVGAGDGNTHMAGVGVIWDWNFWRIRPKTALTAHTEFMLNDWRAEAVGGGSRHYLQAVLLPTLRMRFGQGGSPWFLEVGIGASFMTPRYVTPKKEFSTQWNFYDVLGAGYTFGGSEGHHELNLRWVHVSNGGVQKPNPGQDFAQIRYVHWF